MQPSVTQYLSVNTLIKKTASPEFYSKDHKTLHTSGSGDTGTAYEAENTAGTQKAESQRNRLMSQLPKFMQV